MSQSIERNGLLPHTPATVTLLTRTARPGRATAGLPSRILLSFLAGLMSLLVVAGLPADSVLAHPGPLHETAFEHRPVSEPATSPRIDRAALDLDESETHLRLAPTMPGPAPVARAAGCRPCSDDPPAATDHALPERPPRA